MSNLNSDKSTWVAEIYRLADQTGSWYLENISTQDSDGWSTSGWNREDRFDVSLNRTACLDGNGGDVLVVRVCDSENCSPWSNIVTRRSGWSCPSRWTNRKRSGPFPTTGLPPQSEPSSFHTSEIELSLGKHDGYYALIWDLSRVTSIDTSDTSNLKVKVYRFNGRSFSVLAGAWGAHYQWQHNGSATYPKGWSGSSDHYRISAEYRGCAQHSPATSYVVRVCEEDSGKCSDWSNVLPVLSSNDCFGGIPENAPYPSAGLPRGGSGFIPKSPGFLR